MRCQECLLVQLIASSRRSSILPQHHASGCLHHRNLSALALAGLCSLFVLGAAVCLPPAAVGGPCLVVNPRKPLQEKKAAILKHANKLLNDRLELKARPARDRTAEADATDSSSGTIVPGPDAGPFLLLCWLVSLSAALFHPFSLKSVCSRAFI